MELLASVEVHAGAETLILPARNISLGGIYLGSDGNDVGAFAVGAELELLLFDAADESRAPVRGFAKIVRVHKDGLALQWSADAELQRGLDALIAGVQHKST